MSKRTHGKGWSFTPAESPQSAAQETLPPEKHRIKINLEKRRKGKIVTLIGNLALSKPDLKDLAKALKTACGTGGTAQNDVVELQGDHRDRARTWLSNNGWGVK
ncbi:MAG: translation initiation factor [bacterium]|nr:translation initiation factor [bacterium]